MSFTRVGLRGVRDFGTRQPLTSVTFVTLSYTLQYASAMSMGRNSVPKNPKYL